MSVRLITLCVTLLCAAQTPAEAASEGRRALEICNAADARPAGERRNLLDRVHALAERALQTTPDDPDAHLAASCALGKRARDIGLSFTAIGLARRARDEIETALTLAPDYVPALVAKGILLVEAPSIVGGDVEEGVVLLRRALRREPSNLLAREYLKRASQGGGPSGSESATVLARRGE